MHQLHSRTLHSLTVFETYSTHLEKNPLEIQLEPALPGWFKFLQPGPYDFGILAQIRLWGNQQKPVRDTEFLWKLFQSVRYNDC